MGCGGLLWDVVAPVGRRGTCGMRWHLWDVMAHVGCVDVLSHTAKKAK
jgi:hypothetical protein